MSNLLRKIQLTGAMTILIATGIAFVIEVVHMIDIRSVLLPDLLLLSIYLEVIGMVTSYWRTLTIRLTYPLFIAITALSRLIILQKKDIFRFIASGIGRSDRKTTASGAIPMLRRAATLC